jgi:hypothetical protein
MSSLDRDNRTGRGLIAVPMKCKGIANHIRRSGCGSVFFEVKGEFDR